MRAIKPAKMIDAANSMGTIFLLKCAPPDAGEPYAQGRCRKYAATWNKEVTRNKNVSNNIDNKYRITKINPKIPTITTIGLKKERRSCG